jgi:hypothetical protein
LQNLASEPERAIIINVNTKLVTTLALLSAIRHAGMPVLLIDCESSDGSLNHFQILMKKYEFDILIAPLRAHGLTLDWLFRNITSEKVLLVDSDIEIKDAAIITFFKEYIDKPCVFGCGFTNGPGWLTDPVYRRMGLEGALFHERPWIPLTFFKSAPVREALNRGKSFVNFNLDNEYSMLPQLAKLRSKYGFIRKLLKRGPAKLRRHFHGLKPATVCYDTGAQIFEYLRYEMLMYFVGLPEPVHSRFVTHYMGVTRNVLDPGDKHGCGGLAKINDEVRHRLFEVYGEEVP